MGININVPNQINQNTPLRPVRSGSTAEPDYSVKYVPQTLTEDQQAQARENIGAAAAGEGGQQIQSDWAQTDTSAVDYIKNKPTIPAAQVQSDWNQTDDTAVDYIKNKPEIPNFLPSTNPVMFDKRTAELFFTRRNSVSLSAKYDWMWTAYEIYRSSNPNEFQNIPMEYVSHAYLHFTKGGYWSVGDYSLNIRNDNNVWMWVNDLSNGGTYFNRINFNAGGTFNMVYKGSYELYRFGYSTGNTNHPEQCWTWLMSNDYKGDFSSEHMYGNIVLADATMANFKILDSGSISSLITFDIYVPKSRLTEFKTRMETLYGTSEYTSYIEPKVHTYDFIAQSGLTLKMITLPTLPLTMTDANNNTISGDFVAQNITIA